MPFPIFSILDQISELRSLFRWAEKEWDETEANQRSLINDQGPFHLPTRKIIFIGNVIMSANIIHRALDI